MTRKEELKILITDLTRKLSDIYDDINYKEIHDIIKNHNKIVTLQTQLDNYIKEYKCLNEK